MTNRPRGVSDLCYNAPTLNQAYSPMRQGGTYRALLVAILLLPVLIMGDGRLRAGDGDAVTKAAAAALDVPGPADNFGRGNAGSGGGEDDIRDVRDGTVLASSLDVDRRQPSPAVLVINSYHIGYEWSDDIMVAIRDAFAATMPRANIYFEYLDSKRFPWDAERSRTWADELKRRYQGIRFDAIIVSDDIAYRFILQHHQSVFADVPVVFCGVNYFEPADIAGDPLITGVVQTVEFVGNVELIRKILPSVRRVYAIVDKSLTGEAYRQAIQAEAGQIPDVDIQILDGRDISFDDLLVALAHLENNSAALMLLFLEDKDGTYLPQHITYPRIAAASRVPVFQVTESGLGFGLGGGYIQTGRSQGRTAALMAMDILRDVPVASLPVEVRANPEQRIDWNALSKYWGVSRKDFLSRTGAGQPAQLPARPTRIEYKVCLSNEPVISRYNSIAGWFSGLAVELLEIVARRAGWHFEYVYVEEAAMLQALNQGKCDLAMPSGGDELTHVKLDFTQQPLFSNWGAVYVREGSPVSGLRDLRNMSVALVSDSAFATHFIDQAQDLGLNPGLVWADTYNEALTMLVEGTVDAAVVSRLHPISTRFAYRIRPSDILIYPTGQRIATLKGSNGEFLEAFDAYIPTLKADPSSGYMDVLSRYTFKQKVAWVPAWIWLILGGFGIAIVFVVMLRGEVYRKTKELRDREENLTVMLDSIGDAVIATDAGMVITRINPVACRLTGWSEFEALGRRLPMVFNVVDPVTRSPMNDWIQPVMAGSSVNVGMDVAPQLLARTGAEMRVDQSASPIRDKDGKVVGAIVVFRDVTETIAREERRRQSQKMEAIGQLAGGIAHDFNNILGGVVGIAEFLASRYREDPTILKYCGHIVHSGRRASQMTRRLLDFARLGKAESVPLSVNAIVASAVEILKGSIVRNIEIVTDLRASPDVIVGDASQIENMILNLGINSRDALPNGGRIQIATRTVDFGDAVVIGKFHLPAGRFVSVSVSDNGVGMTADVRSRIFEPFFTTKETGKGTGLGLAAVMGIVEEHQGAIDVRSDISQGTEFTVYFPLSGVQDTLEPELRSDEVRNYRGVVLVIDDEPIIRTMAEVLLSESGFDVITASGGREGIDIYKQRADNIDVVLLDFIMPGMDGLATLKELKAFDSSVRVVIASGFTSEHRRQNFIDAGAVDAVGKPFSQQEICDVLARAASTR